MKTLVLGASTNPNRYSYKAIESLKSHQHEVYAIGQKIGQIFGVEIHTDKLDILEIDTVTLYLNPLRQKDYYTYILDLNPRRVIFNPGTENPDFYKLLEEKNIQFEIACTLVLLATRQY